MLLIVMCIIKLLQTIMFDLNLILFKNADGSFASIIKLVYYINSMNHNINYDRIIVCVIAVADK